MLVIEDKQAIILSVPDRTTILSTIPTSKPARQTMVVVPHRLEETKVLRNLGHKVPSPILHYYKWPPLDGKYPPFSHQKDTAAFLTMHMRCLVLNGMGTGKTGSALWAADYLMGIGAIKKVLIISPLSTLERVWADTIFSSFYHRSYAVLHGTAAKRKALLAQEHDFYIINHDGFKIIAEDAAGMFDLIIVDEAAELRNPSTDRFRFVRRYTDKHPNCRLWLMTGTPTPNEPTDAWALAKLVNSPTLGSTYTGFRDKVMMKLGKWRMVPRPDSIDTVADILRPSIRYSLDSCVDLPEVIYQTRAAELSKEQTKAYKEMVKNLVVEAENGSITAANEAIKAQKLVQIACGVAYDEHGKSVELDCAPRLAVLHEVIKEADGKVIIFVPLTGVLHKLERELKKEFTVEVVNGAVSAGKRAVIFQRFQDARDPQILLAHPATMAHGLTLTAAKAIIWYGPITSNEKYVQANARTERIGKKHTTVVVHIEATDLERRMFKRLQSKEKMQGILLDILAEQNNDRH